MDQFTLQMLFENAIKHNIISKEKPLNIHIKYLDGNIIVENNLQRRQNDEISNRIELLNTANRYKFLSEREVVVKQNIETFSVISPVLNVEK